MPKITSITIQEKNKNRCNLFVDGEFYSGVSIEVIMNSRLKVGMEIPAVDLNKLVNESMEKEAFEKAVTYLSRALKTKKQVYTYLINKGYSNEIAWSCVDKLKDYNLINDCEYSKRYIESTSKNQGKRLIEYKLMMKGIKKEEIESAYSECDILPEESALLVAEKYLKNKENTKENINKAYRYLINRGFSYEEAKFALSKYKDGE